MQSYVRLDDTMCSSSGVYSEYQTFDEAKEACSTDSNCKMFNDNCGRGTLFQLCNDLSTKMNSACGSVVYEKEGK